MNLFDVDPTENRLPRDGVVHYFGPVLADTEASRFFEIFLRDIPWCHDEVFLFGKHIVTARKVAWFGDAGFDYTYSGTTKRALPWSPDLRRLKATVESITGVVFNSCLLNFYHNGTEGMTWHSDDESSLIPKGSIASLSLGAERKFSLKHKQTGETVSIPLEHGSLLVMKDPTQTHWLHSVPKSKRVTTPRINLTFRCMR